MWGWGKSSGANEYRGDGVEFVIIAGSGETWLQLVVQFTSPCGSSVSRSLTAAALKEAIAAGKRRNVAAGKEGTSRRGKKKGRGRERRKVAAGHGKVIEI